MFKIGIQLLFGTFSQIIVTIIAYEFYLRYAIVNGGIGGTAISNIHPIIWMILLIELAISIALIKKGLTLNKDENINIT